MISDLQRVSLSYFSYTPRGYGFTLLWKSLKTEGKYSDQTSNILNHIL